MKSKALYHCVLVKESYQCVLNEEFEFIYQAPAAIATKKKKKKSGANLNIQSVQGYKSYRSRLVKWLTLENEKKTADTF